MTKLQKFTVFAIILTILITIYFLGDSKKSAFLKTTSQLSSQKDVLTPATPAPFPLPTFSPLTERSDLSEEVTKLTPPEYSSDFKALSY